MVIRGVARLVSHPPRSSEGDIEEGQKCHGINTETDHTIGPHFKQLSKGDDSLCTVSRNVQAGIVVKGTGG
jgi:hypothetical protein